MAVPLFKKGDQRVCANYRCNWVRNACACFAVIFCCVFIFIIFIFLFWVPCWLSCMFLFFLRYTGFAVILIFPSSLLIRLFAYSFKCVLTVFKKNNNNCDPGNTIKNYLITEWATDMGRQRSWLLAEQSGGKRQRACGRNRHKSLRKPSSRSTEFAFYCNEVYFEIELIPLLVFNSAHSDYFKEPVMPFQSPRL